MTYRELLDALMSLPEDVKDLTATVWLWDTELGALDVTGFTPYDSSIPVSVDNPPDLDVTVHPLAEPTP